MKAKKHWYDYLWIASLTYLVLGFFNILFAWLGLICFFLPLGISIARGNKAYCSKYCGRGQLFALLGGRLGLSRKRDLPRWMSSKAFRYGFLVFFFLMFFQMLWTTYLVFAGVGELRQVVTLLWTFRLPWHWAYHGGFLVFFFLMFFQMLWTTYLVFAGVGELRQVVTLLWTFRLPWHWAYHGTLFSDGVAQFAFGFYSVMLTSTVLGLVTMVLYKPRSWCAYCPMGTMTQLICKAKARGTEPSLPA